MLNKKHILIYILIAGIIFTLPACSNGTGTQVTESSTSTESSDTDTQDPASADLTKSSNSQVSGTMPDGCFLKN